MNQRCHRRQLRSELREGFEVELELELLKRGPVGAVGGGCMPLGVTLRIHSSPSTKTGSP